MYLCISESRYCMPQVALFAVRLAKRPSLCTSKMWLSQQNGRYIHIHILHILDTYAYVYLYK